MLFQGKGDTLMVDIKGDSIASKAVFVIKLDEDDSLAPPSVQVERERRRDVYSSAHSHADEGPVLCGYG